MLFKDKNPKLSPILKKDENFMKDFFQYAQEADVAKTKMRQFLRETGHKEIEEKYVSPEIYSKSKAREKKNWLKVSGIIFSLFFLPAVFFAGKTAFYYIDKYFSDREKVTNKISIIEDRTENNINILNNIRESTNRMSEKISIISLEIEHMSKNYEKRLDTQDRKIEELKK